MLQNFSFSNMLILHRLPPDRGESSSGPENVSSWDQTELRMNWSTSWTHRKSSAHLISSHLKGSGKRFQYPIASQLGHAWGKELLPDPSPDLALPRYSTDQGMSPSSGTQLLVQSPVTSARAPSIHPGKVWTQSEGQQRPAAPLCAGRHLDTGQVCPLVRAPKTIPTLYWAAIYLHRHSHELEI